MYTKITNLFLDLYKRQIKLGLVKNVRYLSRSIVNNAIAINRKRKKPHAERAAGATYA